MNRRGTRTTVTINTRVEENPGEFRVGNLFCNFVTILLIGHKDQRLVTTLIVKYINVLFFMHVKFLIRFGDIT